MSDFFNTNQDSPSDDVGSVTPLNTGGKITFPQLNEDVKAAREAHDEYWLGKGRGEMAYRYHETDQMPENFPDQVKYFAQLNIVKEDIEAINGMLAQSKFAWDVRGRAKDSYDKRRVNVQAEVLEWAGKEAKIRKATLEALRDFNTCGTAYLNHSTDPYYFTDNATMGLVKVSRNDPAIMKLDPQGRKFDGLGGRYLIKDQQITRNQFMAEWGTTILADGKKIDVDKIFKSIKQRGHFDRGIINNSKASPHDDRLSLIQYDYNRWVYLPLFNPITKEPVMMDGTTTQVQIPIPEFRIAVSAGNEILQDNVSDVNQLRLFSSIIYGNNPWRRGPYSTANFLEIKNLQDLINIMLSMTVNNQARQMASPVMMLAGAAKNIDSMVKSIGGYKVWLYEYTQEMKDMGIPLAGAIPHRLEHGNMDNGWFSLLNWILSASERVQTKDVAKGRSPAGVESGVAINQLQQAALLPQRYTQEKLEEPMQSLGKCVHHRLRKFLDYEFELPVNRESDSETGLMINRVVSFEEMTQFMARASENNDARLDLEMISVRKGEARLSLKDWQKSVDPSIFENEARFKEEFKDVSFIENDFTFGEYTVGMTVDTTAQDNKNQRMAQSTIIMESMNNAQAPIAALEYGLKTSDHPDAEKWLDKVKGENEIWQLGMQAKQEIEEQEQLEAENAQQGGVPEPGVAEPDVPIE